MHKSSFKALYVFLTGLLGMILLLLLHRALFVIYDLLGVFFPNAMVFQVDRLTVQAFDFASLLFALFIGGWYGVFLGLHWFSLVYGEGDHGKLFHGFVPHNWRKGERAASKAASVPKKIVAVHAGNERTTSFQSFRRQPAVDEAWNFDDLSGSTDTDRKVVKKTLVRKPAAKKTMVKKVVRKTTAKKKVAEGQPA